MRSLAEKAASKRWRDKNVERVRTYAKEHAKRYAPIRREKESLRIKNNPEKFRLLRASWAKNNPEKCRAYVKNYMSLNKHKINAKTVRRKALKIRAIPKWANYFFIEEIYDLAQRRSALNTGGIAKWHVDHIVPLKSDLVCGLHVENNLQVIPAVENIRKHNRHWPDMSKGYDAVTI